MIILVEELGGGIGRGSRLAHQAKDGTWFLFVPCGELAWNTPEGHSNNRVGHMSIVGAE